MMYALYITMTGEVTYVFYLTRITNQGICPIRHFLVIARPSTGFVCSA